jgi:hypothetical protein
MLFSFAYFASSTSLHRYNEQQQQEKQVQHTSPVYERLREENKPIEHGKNLPCLLSIPAAISAMLVS